MQKLTNTVLTEADVRRAYFVKQQTNVTVLPGTIVTEEARTFMARYGMQLQEGEPTASATPAKNTKPEHMTHLSANMLVPKNDVRIAFRGKLDYMQARLLKSALQAQTYGCTQLSQHLQEAVELLRSVMAADVKGTPLAPWTFMGMDAAALRERSHHPQQYYGVPHSAPTAEMGFAALELNLLRAEARELELAFSQAFVQGSRVEREDIAVLLNRLSSGLYILYCQALAGKFTGSNAPAAASVCRTAAHTVPVEVSARHVHLCQRDVELLFGPRYRLTKKRDLSQPGEFLAEERVTLRTEKGELRNVAILGPVRTATQVELAYSDARKLGLKPPLRLSGDLRDAADCCIVAGENSVCAKGSVIVAQNHIHLTPADAEEMGVADRDTVHVTVQGVRKVTFRDVVVRVSDRFARYMHVDVDEANAAMLDGIVEGHVCVTGKEKA